VERNCINSKKSTFPPKTNALGMHFFIARKVPPAKMAKFLLQKNVTIDDKPWTALH